MKIKVGVLFGGRSVEHEISIISAVQAMAAFDQEKYDVVPIYISKDDKFYTGEILKNIEEYRDIPNIIKKSQRVILQNDEGKVKLYLHPMKLFKKEVDYIDVAFPVVHGTNVEDGCLAGFLHMLDIPYCECDVLSSAVGMDKFAQKAILKEYGIPVLPAKCFDMKKYNKNQKAILEDIEKDIEYPMIVKPINLGSSVGIRKVKNREELEDAIDYGFEFSLRVLVEHAVEPLREINCSVLGDYEYAKPSECEEPINADEILSYQDKYLSGSKSGKAGKTGSKGMSSTKRKLPADIPQDTKEKIQEYAVSAFKALGCNGVVRIDFLLNDETKEIWFNEINTTPGSLSFYLWEATGVSFADLLDEVVNLALKRKREEDTVTYSFDTNVLAGIKLGGSKGKV